MAHYMHLISVQRYLIQNIVMDNKDKDKDIGKKLKFNIKNQTNF